MPSGNKPLPEPMFSQICVPEIRNRVTSPKRVKSVHWSLFEYSEDRFGCGLVIIEYTHILQGCFTDTGISEASLEKLIKDKMR